MLSANPQYPLHYPVPSPTPELTKQGLRLLAEGA